MKVNAEIGVLSAEEYLEREKSSQQKHEFFYGKLIDRPGNTKLHGLLKKRLSRILDALLEIVGLETYTSDIKVSAAEGSVYF
jgi:hypothetical protein